MTGCRGECDHDEDDDDNDDDEDEKTRKTKGALHRSGDEQARLLREREEEEARAGAAERTGRKCEMGRRCRWWKSRGIKPEKWRSSRREKESARTAVPGKGEGKGVGGGGEEGGRFSFFCLFFEDGERDTEGE